MNKLLLLLSFLALIILGVGTAIAPDNPIFWLASSASDFQKIRIVLSGLLLVQLLTNPPRRVWIRVLSGTLASIIAVWAFRQTTSYHMMLLDSLAFIGASISVLITSLERKSPSLLAASYKAV